MSAIASLLVTLFGGQCVSISEQKVNSDGVIMACYVEWNAYILIFELKNEIGTGGSDPFVQASRAFQKYWCADKSM